MIEKLTLAVPSKGRLMDNAERLFSRAGFSFRRDGDSRGYRGELAGMDGIDIAFLSAGEIAQSLKDGQVHMGVTGQDLLGEKLPPSNKSVVQVLPLGFGGADVVVAVPDCWLDVATMADLDEVSALFYTTHNRRLRVATKYFGLTRRFFSNAGVTGYRIIESLGATEGAPAAGTAEVIVDITTTGSTLKANNLRVLDDGVILKSEAVLAAQAPLQDNPRIAELKDRLEAAL